MYGNSFWEEVCEIFEDFIWPLGMFFTISLIIIGAIILPINRASVYGSIRQFKATELTIQTAREKNINLETAALTQEIIECNQWLANTKYWNGTIFNWFTPDEVMDLKPIE